MKFVDEAVITIQSGDGGPGCTSFRRERFIERGGPDGGDGGDGGHVIVKVDPGKRTLYDFHRQKIHRAQKGAQGMGRQKHGKNGSHCYINLPPGTLVRDADTNLSIVDLIRDGDEYVIAEGGKGGRGNKRFATSTNRAPRYSQPGLPGVERRLKLELKLLADVGIVGLPNAGKSTLIAAMSAARPKIGAYPFTTLTPTLGMVTPPFGEPFAVADIPGLIEGAHQGTGLGIKFLKHIERTGILIHLIDAGAIDPGDPLVNFTVVNRELDLYSRALADKTRIIVLNKSDLAGTDHRMASFCQAVPDLEVHPLSAATGQGVDKLITLLASRLQKE